MQGRRPHTFDEHDVFDCKWHQSYMKINGNQLKKNLYQVMLGKVHMLF